MQKQAAQDMRHFLLTKLLAMAASWELAPCPGYAEAAAVLFAHATTLSNPA
jgi:hypothetical protein